MNIKKNLTKDLVKNINISKICLDPKNFVPSLKIEFTISPEQIQDIVNVGMDSKDLHSLIAVPILDAIKDRN
ncbi:hypothetical protein CCP1ISM_90011 [Azospirillaceae bacterium]